MSNQKRNQGSFYHIQVKETIAPSSLEWFAGLEIDLIENDGTMLSGWFPDQPALRGLLEYLWNLNVTIQSVEQIKNDDPLIFVLQRRIK